MIFVFLFALTAVLSAIMDTLQHHWSSSIFRKWEESNKYGYWGDASHVWLRRYVGLDKTRGYVGPLRTLAGRTLLIPVWDGWHLCKTLSVMAMSTALVLTLSLSVWLIPVAYVAWGVFFELFYTKLLRTNG